MGAIYVIVSVLFAVYLLLRILKMLGGGSANAAPPSRSSEKFDPNRFNTAPLPERSAAELESQKNDLKSEWVTYQGATPPLKLLIQGQSYESYRRVVRSQIDLVGQENVERLPPEALADLNRTILANAYVKDWEGAQYPNGNVMPFTPDNLVVRLSGDPYLETFITGEAKRVSPPWPQR